jgi:quercetin dioxygenase-like cupin family protein
MDFQTVKPTNTKEERTMQKFTYAAVVVAFVLSAAATRAQDPVKVDPKHYKVEFENDQVRVLRVKYGPGEKSVMHSHPDGVGVAVTDHHVKFTYPDGKSEERNAKAGQAFWAKGGPHLPENTSDRPLELILIELKGK